MNDNFINEIDVFIDTVFSIANINKPSIEIAKYLPLFDRHKSCLPDQHIDFDKLSQLVTVLGNQKSLLRLNHYGFGYQVDSQISEKNRLINKYKNNPNTHLYREPSVDDNPWVFVGNLKRWDSTMVELCPVEYVSDEGSDQNKKRWFPNDNHPDAKYKDFWFPSIQFDFDTKLNSDQIVGLIKDIYGDRIEPYPAVAIDDVIYVIRCRLGIIDGINIMFDLATISRDVEYYRKNMLKKIA